MTVDTLLENLQKVKKTGASKWQACCPSHHDRSPSLSIRELDDGRVLIHCHAGCGAMEILNVLGLDWAALHASKSFGDQSYKPIRKPWNASDVLSALAFEILLAWNFSKAMCDGKILSGPEHNRLLTCASRMQKGLEVLNG